MDRDPWPGVTLMPSRGTTSNQCRTLIASMQAIDLIRASASVILIQHTHTTIIRNRSQTALCLWPMHRLGWSLRADLSRRLFRRQRFQEWPRPDRFCSHSLTTNHMSCISNRQHTRRLHPVMWGGPFHPSVKVPVSLVWINQRANIPHHRHRIFLPCLFNPVRTPPRHRITFKAKRDLKPSLLVHCQVTGPI